MAEARRFGHGAGGTGELLMLEVDAALELILKNTHILPAEPARHAHELLGHILADDVASDIDSPPFDKSIMDGYAVRSADAASGKTLTVIEEVAAGRVPTRVVGPGEATRVMTGAPIPDGADAVIPHEETDLAGNTVRLRDTVPRGKHILTRGREMKAGEVVVPAGTLVTPATIGLLASVGRTAIRVIRTPRLAIISTGDELVEPAERPGPSQIRNSNGPMLVALAMQARCGSSISRHRPRRPGDPCRPCSRRARFVDIVVLSGGVSAGKFDFVPDVLRELGVQAHFHKVRMKPGKPLLFGTRGNTLVFGLPGNPVSSFVGFELFVRPALRKMGGHAIPGPTFVPMPLAAELKTRNDRPTYLPGRLETTPRLSRARFGVVRLGRPARHVECRRPDRRRGRRYRPSRRHDGSDTTLKHVIDSSQGLRMYDPAIPRSRVFLPAILSGLLLYAAFFPLNLGFLAWIAIVPLLSLVRANARSRRIYFATFVGGLFCYVPAIQWIRVAHPAMYGAWIFLAIVCSLFLVMTLALIRKLDRAGVPLWLSAPIGFIAVEYFRSHFPTGYTWMEFINARHPIGFGWYMVGHTQHDYLSLIQIADITGAYGVTFLVVLVNAAIWSVFQRSLTVRTWLRMSGDVPPVSFRPSLVAMALLLATFAYGMIPPKKYGDGPRVALIQGNIAQDVKNQNGQAMWEHFEALADQAAHVPSQMKAGPHRLAGDVVRVRVVRCGFRRRPI